MCDLCASLYIYTLIQVEADHSLNATYNAVRNLIGNTD